MKKIGFSMIALMLLLCMVIGLAGCQQPEDATNQPTKLKNAEPFSITMHGIKAREHGSNSEIAPFVLSGVFYDDANGNRCVRLDAFEIDGISVDMAAFSKNGDVPVQNQFSDEYFNFEFRFLLSDDQPTAAGIFISESMDTCVVYIGQQPYYGFTDAEQNMDKFYTFYKAVIDYRYS